MLTIEIPSNYQPERQYILSVIFDEFLGLDYQVQICDRANTKISLQANFDRSLIITDKLFNIPEENWLKPSSLPIQPLKIWDINKTKLNPVIVSPHIPVIYGDNPNNLDFFQQSSDQIYLGLDIFGSAFFMLTRYEEIIKPDRDKHNRFPATASLAYQEKFAYRPIIDEYIEILWNCLGLLWNNLERKAITTTIQVSHDVDYPFEYVFLSTKQVLRCTAFEAIKRKNIKRAFSHLVNNLKVKLISHSLDPGDSFDYLMDESEKYNLQSIFYFIPEQLSCWDSNYQIDHHLIISLIKKIYRRGHLVGYHGSYDSFNSQNLISRQVNILRTILEKIEITPINLYSRQHYLRWNHKTWQYLAAANIKIDSTLGFIEIPGYRCGTGKDYSVFDLSNRCPLKLIERPLVYMDGNFGYPYADREQQNNCYVITKNILNNSFLTNLTIDFHNNHINSNDFSKLNFKQLFSYILNYYNEVSTKNMSINSQTNSEAASKYS